MEFDFSGYATRNGIKCSDGRTIMRDAFADQDGQKVPLVWMHQHLDPENVLGHAILENREDGVYVYGSFNDTQAAKNAKESIKHGDINSLSIFANNLKHNGKNVVHGAIREVSLVLTGANPGATIENVYIKHGSVVDELDDDEGVIYSGKEIQVPDNDSSDEEDKDQEVMPEDTLNHAEGVEKTVQDVLNTFNEEQMNVLYFLIGKAVEENEGGSNDDTAEHADTDGDNFMSRNVFDQTESSAAEDVLSHGQIESMFAGAAEMGSLRESVLMHADTYGIKDIETLFPDAKELNARPEFISRRMDWVAKVLGGTKHSPFSRIKTTQADITADEARAKGYVKGNRKKEEVFSLLTRTTTPTTIYKKQKLDRDDILDISSFDVVAWIKAEMRVMLDEEIARAILIGDGRDLENSDGTPNEDKIDENHLRPIWTEDELFAHRVTIPADATYADIPDALARTRKHYKGSGSPKLFTTSDYVTEMLLLKDKMGRDQYATEAALASKIRVSEIVEVEVMEGATRVDDDGNTVELVGIIVNLQDYTVGADKGGEINFFDDFDIDYNQYKYLLETRISGALTKIKSAVIIEKAVAEPVVIPD